MGIPFDPKHGFENRKLQLLNQLVFKLRKNEIEEKVKLGK